MMLFALLVLAFVPILVWRYARSHAPRHGWLATGASLGVVISPLSLGLYSTFFLGPFGLPTGMVGLVSVLFHGAPGFHLAQWLELVPHGVVSGKSHVYVELLNGVIWAVSYGLVGFVADWFRFRGRPQIA